MNPDKTPEKAKVKAPVEMFLNVYQAYSKILIVMKGLTIHKIVKFYTEYLEDMYNMDNLKKLYTIEMMTLTKRGRSGENHTESFTQPQVESRFHLFVCLFV